MEDSDVENEETDKRDPAQKILDELEELRRGLTQVVENQRALWDELDRRTTVDPGQLLVAQKMEQVHNDLRYLLHILRPAVMHGEEDDDDGSLDAERAEKDESA